MSVAKRGDGRFGVKFKGEEGRWGQRSFRPDEEAEAQQFDADCQYDQIENTQLTVLEAVLVFLKNTEHVESTVVSMNSSCPGMIGRTEATERGQRNSLQTVSWIR